MKKNILVLLILSCLTLSVFAQQFNKNIILPLDDNRNFPAVLVGYDSSNENFYYVNIDSTGAIKTQLGTSSSTSDTTYNVSDIDDVLSPNYYGFLSAGNQWYIMEETLTDSTDTYKYLKGDSGYSTTWDARTTFTYSPYNSTF